MSIKKEIGVLLSKNVIFLLFKRYALSDLYICINIATKRLCLIEAKGISFWSFEVFCLYNDLLDDVTTEAWQMFSNGVL